MAPHPHHKGGEQSPKQHRVGEHWSGANPVPTISKFMERLERDKQEREAHAAEVSARHDQRQMDRTAGEAGPHQPRKRPKGKTRMVTDPTTGRDIEVEDQDEESMEVVKSPKLVVPNANLGKPTHVKTDPKDSLSQYKENQDITAPPDPIAEGTTSDVPIHGEKTNILFHPTPTVSYRPMFDKLEKRGITLCVGIIFSVVVLGRYFGGSFWGLLALACCVATAVWLWVKEVIRSGREMEWSTELIRGQMATANLLPESVEWINSFMGVIWSLVNPEMLSPVADTIEDIMQASAPGVVENVRIAEIDQGNNPLRILSLRALPDEHVDNIIQNMREDNKNKDPDEAAALEEGGSYYNLEASFAYHAKPSGQSTSSKARNMHMEIVFYLGVRGLFGVPFPVFVELIEMVGTVRIRFQLMPEPPFMKDMTFSLVGLPHVKAGCMPMVKGGVNILNLPLISNFVNYAIGTACGLFAAPKSMTMDLSAILKGDEIVKETEALGIMWVRIHRAIGLSKQDRRGSYGGGSDPYINLSFSKYGKPMYCTRVICDDLNPVWEETAALLVTPELIKANENLSVELWDSDRNTADDVVGKVELPIREMIQHPCRMYPQVSKLQGLNEGSEMPGELHWEVGFFGKPKLRPELRTDGKKKDLPENLQGNPQFQDPKGVISTEQEDAVVHTPPDPLWPSGILSVVVHQIVNLELANIKGSDGNRKGKDYEPAKPYGEATEEQGSDLPTSYCKIILNDQLIYRTRAKAVSSKPIFNAGTERFVRDWRSAIVTVTVRDQRYREHDPILGVVPLRLTDLLRTSSQLTRWYPLDGGVGHGRIRISLLFRHVETRLPPQMLGWDVGTFGIAGEKVVAQGFGHKAKINLRTTGSSSKINKHVCTVDANHNAVFDLSDESFRNQLRLPVRHRYRSAVVFELHHPGKRSVAGYAVLWLQHLVDNQDTPVDIPIWSTHNGKRLTQNYITEDNWEQKRSPGLEDLQQIGRLQFHAHFTPGIDESHEQFIVDNHSRETFETWEALVAEGVRPRRISSSVPRDIEELHERSLVEGRDILRHASPDERRRWIDKQGQDWSGCFGHDPAAFFDADHTEDTLIAKGRNSGHGHGHGHGHSRQPTSSSYNSSAARTSYSSQDPTREHYHQPAEENNIHHQDQYTTHLQTNNNRPTSAPTSPTNYQYQQQQQPQQRTSLDNGDYDHRRPSTASSIADSSIAGSSIADSSTSATPSKRAVRRSEQRQQRGLMQWKPVRNAAFARDEAKFALRKVRRRFSGDLVGREPDVETETGT